MSWPVDCVNCGRQVLIDGPEDKCYFCGKNASKKEVIMAEETVLVPPKPLRRKKWVAYWEDNKEAIIRDYYSMTVREFYLRWHIATTTWKKLRDKWGLKPKDKGVGRNRRAEQTGKVDWKLKYETYRQAVLDIFGKKSEN